MRVLILADSCNPEWPSLPSVGYNAVRAISDLVEVVLVTQIRNKVAIERAGGCGRAEVVYADTEYIAAPVFKLARVLRGGSEVSWTTQLASSYPAHLAFEVAVWKRFAPDIKAGRFDVVHRLTPMSPTLPSPTAKWSTVPFVLGPLNGGLPWPPAFSRELRREREYLTYVRELHRFLPYYRSTYTRAAAILAGFQHTLDDLPQTAHSRAIDFPEVGIDPNLFDFEGRAQSTHGTTFVYVGRLVPYKCPDVAVAAFARSELLRRHRLLVVGDGPERTSLERAVRSHDLEENVQFLGRKSQREVGNIFQSADILVFPSIRELGAGVVVESMACGCVPVVVNYGAPGALVNDECGVRVGLGTKDELISRFVCALERLAGDEQTLRRLGRGASERASHHFSWSSKARKMLDVYEWVTGRRSARPDFWHDFARKPTDQARLTEARVAEGEEGGP